MPHPAVADDIIIVSVDDHLVDLAVAVSERDYPCSIC